MVHPVPVDVALRENQVPHRVLHVLKELVVKPIRMLAPVPLTVRIGHHPPDLWDDNLGLPHPPIVPQYSYGMATLAAARATLPKAATTFATCAGGGDKTAPGDHVALLVHNADSASHVVTINSVAPSNYGTDEDVATTVAAGEYALIGPLPASRFAGTDGLVSWTYSAVTSMTVAVVSI